MADIVAFFSAEQAARLASIPETLLRSWDRIGLVPAPRFEEKVHGFSRIYSFRDVVGLRALGDLHRKDVSTQQLRKFRDWYQARYDESWTQLAYGLAGKTVCFREPGTGRWLNASGHKLGQAEHPKLMKIAPIVKKVERAFKQLKRRPKSEHGRLEKSRNIAGNQMRVAGTRITTALIWEYAQSGYAVDEIVHEFPTLTARDVKKAIEHEEKRGLRKAS